MSKAIPKVGEAMEEQIDDSGYIVETNRPKPHDTSFGVIGNSTVDWTVAILSMIPHLMVLVLLIYAITQ